MTLPVLITWYDGVDDDDDDDDDHHHHHHRNDSNHHDNDHCHDHGDHHDDDDDDEEEEEGGDEGPCLYPCQHVSSVVLLLAPLGSLHISLFTVAIVGTWLAALVHPCLGLREFVSFSA